MMTRRMSSRLYGAVLATVFAPVVTLVTGWPWQKLHLAINLIVFALLWFGFYSAGTWALTERTDELNRKIPISSKEHRRRKKEFYDWLDSQSRRNP